MTDLENLRLKVVQVNNLMQETLKECENLLYQAGAGSVEFHLEKLDAHRIGMKTWIIHTINVEVKL